MHDGDPPALILRPGVDMSGFEKPGEKLRKV